MCSMRRRADAHPVIFLCVSCRVVLLSAISPLHPPFAAPATLYIEDIQRALNFGLLRQEDKPTHKTSIEQIIFYLFGCVCVCTSILDATAKRIPNLM